MDQLFIVMLKLFMAMIVVFCDVLCLALDNTSIWFFLQSLTKLHMISVHVIIMPIKL